MEPLLAAKKIFFTASAIYISDSFVDVAQANVSLGGMSISFLQRFPLKKILKDASFYEISGEVDNVLEKVYPKEEDKPCRIAINVKNNYLILRRFTIRDIPKREMGQVITFEAQKYIPSLIDNLTYSFRSYPRGNGLQEIVFAGAETKNIREITDFFNERRILPSTIEPIPILLARSLRLKKNLKKEGAYICIHYEPANKVILCEISHQYPYFFREINISHENDDMPLRLGGAELSYPTLKSVWPNIEREVIGGIDYLRKETNENVEKIFISGFARSSDETAISQEFGIPFERLDLSYFKGVDEEIKDRHLPALMLLYDSQQKPYLNIAPDDIIKNDLWSLKTVGARSLAALAVILLAHSFLAGINVQKSWKVEEARKGFDKHTVVGRAPTKEDVTRYRAGVIEKAAFVNSLVERKNYISEKLRQLEEVLPQECWVDKLYYNAKSGGQNSLSLVISGSIFGNTPGGTSDINKIFDNIKQNKKLMRGFAEAELVSVERKELFGKEFTDFEIVLK